MEINIRKKYEEKYKPKLMDAVFNYYRIKSIISKYQNDFPPIPTKDFWNITNQSIAKLNRIVRDYIVFQNGFIGNDYYLLRYSAYNLLLYSEITISEDLTENEHNICQLEIETWFYFFLNCIYNIKEKFEKFVNFNTSECRLENNILTEEGEKKILNLFKNIFMDISKWCNARGEIVHDNYTIRYDREKQKVIISCFAFNLSTDKIKGKNRFDFQMTTLEIKKVLESIYYLIDEFLEIMKNTDNIDTQKLKQKFISEDGKSSKITF